MSFVSAAAAPSDVVGYSIVLIGQFEPAKAQPSVLVKNGLLEARDISDLTYDVLMADLVSAKLPWINFSIERNKLSASSTLQSPAGEPIRDFVLDLAELMPVKRYTALGINRDNHFAVRTREDIRVLLERLIAGDLPLSEQTTAGQDEFGAIWQGALKQPMPSSLSVVGQRDDEMIGSITVRVEPSLQVIPGVYTQVNDHFDAPPDLIDREPDHLLRQLDDDTWRQAMLRADRIVDAIRSEMHAIS